MGRHWRQAGAGVVTIAATLTALGVVLLLIVLQGDTGGYASLPAGPEKTAEAKAPDAEPGGELQLSGRDLMTKAVRDQRQRQMLETLERQSANGKERAGR